MMKEMHWQAALCAPDIQERFVRVHLLIEFLRADLPCKFHNNTNVCGSTLKRIR